MSRKQDIRNAVLGKLNCGYLDIGSSAGYEEEFDYICELVEKDIPKRPLKEHGGIWCPHCKALFQTVKSPYGPGPAFTTHCESCGQKLDWGLDDAKEN